MIKRKKIKIFLFMVFVLLLLFIFALKFGPKYNFYVFPLNLKTPKGYVSYALNLMENHAMHGATEEFKIEKKLCLRDAEKIKNFEDARGLVRRSLKVAGGKHSFLLDKDKIEKLKNELPSFSFDGCLKDGAGIFYLKLPETDFLEKDYNKYYGEVLEFIKLHRKDIKGVIIDLRDNCGGNMYPMLFAVSPFLEDGLLFEVQCKNIWYPIELNKGKISNCNDVVEDFKIEKIPIAILQNEKTASAAEMVLIAFKGCRRCYTFGTPSAGFATTNSSFYVDEDLMLISTGKVRSKTKEEFGENPIAPNYTVEEDLKKKAKSWMLYIFRCFYN